MDVYLLTKPPGTSRAELCFRLLARSSHARLYLAGDGVYCLLQELDLKPAAGIFACKEDLEARGVHGKGASATILERFYDQLVQDLVGDGVRVYVF